jgi:hypothetical protein
VFSGKGLDLRFHQLTNLVSGPDSVRPSPSEDVHIVEPPSGY